MKRRQKIILGLILCLSIVMILTAIVRISAIRIGKKSVDLVWLNFWQIIESALAVGMVCISAFRSVFIGINAQSKQPWKQPWYAHEKNPKNIHKRKNWMDIESDETETLPEIPRATMTGIRTLVRGKPDPEGTIMHSGVLDEKNDQSALAEEMDEV